MEVKYVLFKIGLEVIAQVESEVGRTTGTYKLKNPVRCMVGPSEDGQGIQIGFAPLHHILKLKQTISVDTDQVAFTAELNDDVLNMYNSQFGSGIVTAGAQALDTLNSKLAGK